MTELTYLFGALAVLAGMVTSISVWAPRRLSVKILAVAAAALFLPTTYAGLAELLSRPKPVGLEWWHANAAEATVLGARFEEEVAIHIWLQLPEIAEPRGYSLPWSRDLAEQLQTAQREADENQSQVQMRLPFEGSLDDLDARFYAMPQAALPPKDTDRSPAQVYERHAQSGA
jgi:hypothetical protein